MRRKIALVVGFVVVAGGGLALSTGLGQAGENCAGLDGALRNNLNFIAEQQRNPDALSAARIANRQAVVDLIQQRRATAGCTADVGADVAAPNPAPVATTRPPATTAPPGSPAGVVCAGSTVTLSGEEGAPAASSNQFPIGTRLRVTNVDNDKSVTVEVTGPSGSCVLLNNSAFEQVREPGKFLIRRAVVERLR